MANNQPAACKNTGLHVIDFFVPGSKSSGILAAIFVLFIILFQVE